MASQSSPLLLDLREEDFQRGYTGSRPPSLISPEPQSTGSARISITVEQPRSSGRGKTIALFVVAIVASAVTSKLLTSAPPQQSVFGLEAAQKARPQPEPVAPVVAEPKPEPAKPVVAEVAKPIATAVQPAVIAPPVVAAPKPIAAAPKPSPPPQQSEAAKAEPKPEAPPKAETPTFGVDEAGF